MKTPSQRFALAVCIPLLLTMASGGAQAPAVYGPPEYVPMVQSAPQSPQELQQLVAPIALYPDALVAQVLAASTYPAEVVEASGWMRANSGLKGMQLADAVNAQSWDPSVQALTQFPSVLDNMARNLSWTSALGAAYVNQPAEVMDAIQLLRQRAQAAGTLRSTGEQLVTTQGATVLIAPANPDVVYVPVYDPWLAYGAPLITYPGWVPAPGLFYDGPGLYFGAGIGIGLFAGFAFGFHHFDADFRRREVLHDRQRFVSHSPTFMHRPGVPGRPGEPFRRPEFRGAEPHLGAGPRPGPFSGFDHGGTARGFSGRGHASLGGAAHQGGFARGGGFQGGAGAYGAGGRGGGGHR